MRPLFLEYPDAAPDHHPIDTDIPASGEFLLGRDLLIAAPPFPDELDSYTIEFPSLDWYNYWTGEKVALPRASDPIGVQAPAASAQVQLSIQVKPELDTLPIFVHAGSILPIEPLVQSANESPKGPLTLRVYAGDNCNGSLYQDDGRTYAYKNGAFLRMKFIANSCRTASDCTPTRRKEPIQPGGKTSASRYMDGNPPQIPRNLDGKPLKSTASPVDHGVAIIIPSNSKGFDLQLR